MIFSFVGYENQIVAINGQTTINITLKEGTSLNEVVVVGYGIQKKRDLTGSIASANLEAFKESPNVSILQSLKGSLPGLFIGKPIGTIYNYQVEGIWGVNDTKPTSFDAGSYKIKDQNGDGKITPEDDRVILGNRKAAYMFGIQNNVSFKNFTLRFFINSIQGGSTHLFVI